MPDPVIATFYARDASEVDTYSHAIGYKCLIFDLENRIRSDLKYTDMDKIESAYKYGENLLSIIGDLKMEYHLPED